jgi:NAD(P)-dependent dehydrogenase (short-subunit alcohol dehydrogenase family)
LSTWQVTVMEFLGKRVLVTGAANGIGAECAKKFHTEGASLTLLDVESGALEKLSRQLDADFCAIDLSQIDKLKRNIANIGEQDVIINCAGVNIESGFLDYSDADWRRIFDVNLFAPLIIVRVLAPRMIERRGGVIVNISSQLAFRGSPNRSAYGACKAALAHMTQSLAAEWGPYGVRVVGVAPGRTATRMTEDIRAALPAQELARTVPLGRFGLPGEIAEAVCFVASERASYITGTTLVVDGGFLCV